MTTILYILGSTRSGTSALRNAIAGTRYKGFGEGHLVPILMDIIESVQTHSTSGLGADVPGNGLSSLKGDDLIRALFAGYEQYLSDFLKSPYIVDKTPTITPIRATPDLARYHGNAKFIHCSRRHIDNVQSKIKKFPDKPLENHAREWSDCHDAWFEVKHILEERGTGFLEINFHEMAADPSNAAKKIGRYLELNGEEISGIESYLQSQRPQATQDRDLNKFLKLSELRWSDLEKRRFVEITSRVGSVLGYGLESYYQDQVTLTRTAELSSPTATNG